MSTLPTQRAWSRMGLRVALWSVCYLLSQREGYGYCKRNVQAITEVDVVSVIPKIEKRRLMIALPDSARKAKASTELTIAIRVVDSETNEPVSGSQLQVMDEQTQQQLALKSDSLGHNAFVVVAPGRPVVVVASAPGYVSVKTRLANVIASRQITLKLTKFKPSVLTIKVFSGTIRQPLPSAVVTITSRHTGRSERFDLPDGRLERRFTEPDELDIHVSAIGYTSVDRQLSIDVPLSGKTFELDAELDKLTADLILRAVDSQTGKPISSAKFTLTPPAGKIPLVLSVDSATGRATARITDKGLYQLTITAGGYDTYTRSVVVDKEQKEVVNRLIARLPASDAKPVSFAGNAIPATSAVSPATTKPFGRIEKGKRIELNRLYFDQSSPVLRLESYTELDQLVDLLTQSPTLQIEIRGHTDNQGDFTLNAQLSLDRCQAVIDYLVQKGISANRLKAVGRGPLDPVAPNTNEANRKKNRRVEFVVLED